MTERWVAQIMGQAGGLNGLNIYTKRVAFSLEAGIAKLRQAATYLRHLVCVLLAGMEYVSFTGSHDLGYASETMKG